MNTKGRESRMPKLKGDKMLKVSIKRRPMGRDKNGY